MSERDPEKASPEKKKYLQSINKCNTQYSNHQSFLYKIGIRRIHTVKDPEPSGFVVANVMVKLSCSFTLCLDGS